VSPNVFVADNVPPNLVRWYIDRSTMLVHCLFDEPVKVGNITDIALYVRGSPTAVGFILNKPPHYRSSNSEVILTLSSECPTCTTASFFSYVNSSKAYVSISLGPASFYDFAAIPNYVSEIPISIARREGSTGEHTAATGPGTVIIYVRTLRLLLR
jgi:hypothetical protein